MECGSQSAKLKERQAPTRSGSIDQRLTRARRLTPAQYREVFATSRPLPGRLVVLWIRQVSDDGQRMGVVVSRKNFRTAVSRNRARRLMREAFRHNRMHLQSGVEIVMVARYRMKNVKAQEVAEDFRYLCKRAGIWQQTEAH